ncbi:hypothetical protein QBC39DRAFT_151223 [Podospora conica]|nr:hypothetical protein QBC39DRAFT_151223 [Schizothecium conicum]
MPFSRVLVPELGLSYPYPMPRRALRRHHNAGAGRGGGRGGGAGLEHSIVDGQDTRKVLLSPPPQPSSLRSFSGTRLAPVSTLLDLGCCFPPPRPHPPGSSETSEAKRRSSGKLLGRSCVRFGLVSGWMEGPTGWGRLMGLETSSSFLKRGFCWWADGVLVMIPIPYCAAVGDSGKSTSSCQPFQEMWVARSEQGRPTSTLRDISGDGVALGLSLCNRGGKISPTWSNELGSEGTTPLRFLFRSQAIQPPASPHDHRHGRELVNWRIQGLKSPRVKVSSPMAAGIASRQRSGEPARQPTRPPTQPLGQLNCTLAECTFSLFSADNWKVDDSHLRRGGELHTRKSAL